MLKNIKEAESGLPVSIADIQIFKLSMAILFLIIQISTFVFFLQLYIL